MPNLRRLIFVGFLLGAGWVSSLQAIAPLGRGRLVGNVVARVDYDSNIFVNDKQVDDLVGTFDAGVRYVQDAALLTFEAAVGATVLSFADHDDQNGADPYLEGRLGYKPSDKTNLNGTLTYRKNSLANDAVNDRTESNDLVLDGRFEHLTTEKLGFRLTGAYSKSDYLTAGYSDIENYGLGAHVLHVYSPKLNLLAGIHQNESWTKPGATRRRSAGSRDWRYTVGAEGEFAPKVKGEASVGVVQRSFKGTGFTDGDELFLAGLVTWAAAEKTSFTLRARRDVSLSAADQAVKSFNVSVSVSHALAQKLDVEGSVGYDHSNYVGFLGASKRDDDGMIYRARLNYTLNDRVSFDVSTGYRNSTSNFAAATYDRFNFGAGVSARF